MGKKEPPEVSASRKAARKQKKTGRPPKINQERIQKIAEGLSVGMYFEGAAARAGICKKTAYDWLRKAERLREALPEELRTKPEDWEKSRTIDADDRPYLLFLHAVEKAEAEAEFRDLAIVSRHSARSWQAAAWKLERRHPQKYGRMNRVELSGPEGGEVPIQGFAVTVVERRELSKDEFLDGVGMDGLGASEDDAPSLE